jgi:predicted ATP-grasp superfamily ATP-dependent carboligase
VEYAGAEEWGAISIEGSEKMVEVQLNDVTIKESLYAGLYLKEQGRLRNGSGGLKITGTVTAGTAGGFPIVTGTPGSHNLPKGEYTNNAVSAVNLFVYGASTVDIATNTTWRNIGIPYAVSANVVVEGTAAPTLTIDPGVIVLFAHDTSLIVGRSQAGALVADATARLEAACINLGSPPSVIRLCADKLETTELLLHNGLCAPRIIREGAHQGAIKCVVKPRTGCGSEGVFVSGGPVERDGYISTEYIEGEHLSVSLVSGSGFVLPLTLNRQHIHMNGSVVYDGNDVNIEHPARDEIFGVARRAGLMLGCRGLFGVDIVYADQPCVVDVNPRPTTAMVGVARAIDRNLADLALLARFGELPDHVGYRGRCSFTKRDLGAFL